MGTFICSPPPSLFLFLTWPQISLDGTEWYLGRYLETLALLKEVGFECSCLVSALKEEVSLAKSQSKKKRVIDMEVDAKIETCVSMVCGYLFLGSVF